MKTLFDSQEVLEIVQSGCEDLAANPTKVQRTAFIDEKKKYCKAPQSIHNPNHKTKLSQTKKNYNKSH